MAFSSPVYHVVVDGIGAFQCSGSSYGSVAAVTTHGDTVGAVFTAFNPECGDDDVACCLRATVPTDSAISSLLIFQMLPADFALPPPYNSPAHSWMQYVVNFDHWRRCPPVTDTLFDSYINDPKLRSGMTEAWKNSNPDTTAANRRERGGFLYRDPVADTTFYVLTPNVADTPCRSVNQAPAPPPPISWIVAEFHTHPFKDYEALPKSPGCPNPNSHTAAKYDAVVHGGPSFVPNDSIGGGGDWARSVRHDLLPMYIMDKQNIFETDTSKHDSTSWGPGSAKKWARMKSSCFLF